MQFLISAPPCGVIFGGSRKARPPQPPKIGFSGCIRAARTVLPSLYRIFSVTSVRALSSIDMMKKRMTILVSNIPAFW